MGAPQLLVVERLQRLDLVGLQELGAQVTGRSDMGDAARLGQHARLAGLSQVAEHPCPEIDALADVEGDGLLFPVELVHAMGAEIDIDILVGYPCLYNNEAVTARARALASDYMGAAHVQDNIVKVLVTFPSPPANDAEII